MILYTKIKIGVTVLLTLSLHCSISVKPALIKEQLLAALHADPDGKLVATEHLYQLAVKLNVPEALLRYYDVQPHLSEQQKLIWLSQPQLLDHWRTNWYLGKFWQEKHQRQRAILWLNSAEKRCRVDVDCVAQHWYQMILLQLSKVQLDVEEYAAAENTLQQLAATTIVSGSSIHRDMIILTAQLAMMRGALRTADDLLHSFNFRSVGDGNVDLTPLVNLQDHIKQLLHTHHITEACVVNVQFFVADYPQWRFAHQLLNQWQHEQRLHQLAICFHPIRWFDVDALNCSAVKDKRLNCDLTQMAANKLLTEQFLPEQFLPVFFFGEAGIANYNNGIIFINRSKSFGVFVHELLHHFDFMDEYPINNAIGEKLCAVNQPKYIGENLLIVPNEQVAAVLSSDHYQQQLTPVDTCRAFKSTAFKFVTELTIMAYTDQIIPDAYLARVKDKMDTRPYSFSNYQYAFALAFLAKGEENKYFYWLNESAQQGYAVADSLLGQ